MSPEPYSVVHHLTSIHFREPGYLWKLPVAFIWGPTGGTLTIPPAFYRHIGLKQAMFELVRSASNWLTIRYRKRINQAIQKSAIIYAFSEEDRKVFQARGARRVELMLDAGCELRVSEFQSFRVSEFQALKVLWVGQLIRRKALDILLKAVAGDEELRKCVEITVIGDGPLRSYYEKLALELFSVTRHSSLVTHHSSLITFLGQLPREKVFEHMRNADVLVHTSYREATSNVIPEALSCGLPVICHDISGMAIAVTDECGIRVPLKSYNESIRGFREALRKLCSDRYRLSVIGYPLNETDNRQPTTDNRQLTTDLHTSAFQRAEQLSWDSMASQIAQDYARIAH